MPNLHEGNPVTAVDSAAVDGVDFFRRFDLPPLRRMADEEARDRIEPLQVVRRLQALGLTDRDLFTPEARWKPLYYTRRCEQARLVDPGDAIRFDGATVAELNRFLADSPGSVVRVAARELVVDETLRVPSRTALIGAPTTLNAQLPLDAVVEIRDAVAVRVESFRISGRARVGIHIKNGTAITLLDNVLTDVDGRPIVAMGRVVGLDILRNLIRSNGCGGMYLRGDIGPGLIQGNRIEDNRCARNLTAGLVLSSRPVFDVNDPEGGEPVGTRPTPLHERLDSPHDIVIRRNTIDRNASSGLYCCGVHCVYMIENTLTGNDKEGICIDYGTVGSYIRGNRIAGNGGRSRQSDDDLRRDFVHHIGRMSDGSSNAKLPGLSIDNSACNIIHENTVTGNFGGGIKTVRTGIRNLICHNLIVDNNRGRNSIFHFFGVELGNPAPDEATNDLDFTAGFENIIFRNVIEGSHYAGLIMVEGCYRNDVFDNCIFGATAWAIESLSSFENSVVNNLSTIATRGLLSPTPVLPAPEPMAPEPMAPPAVAAPPEAVAAPPEAVVVVHQAAEVPPARHIPGRPVRAIKRCGRHVRSWYRSARSALARVD